MNEKNDYQDILSTEDCILSVLDKLEETKELIKVDTENVDQRPDIT